jgi:hypothetical protein
MTLKNSKLSEAANILITKLIAAAPRTDVNEATPGVFLAKGRFEGKVLDKAGSRFPKHKSLLNYLAISTRL